MVITYLNHISAVGEATLTDAMTAAGKTYEEIAQMVAEQVRTKCNITAMPKITELFLPFLLVCIVVTVQCRGNN